MTNILIVDEPKKIEGDDKEPWLCWENSPLQLCPCGKLVEPKYFLDHLGECEVGTEHYRKIIKKVGLTKE